MSTNTKKICKYCKSEIILSAKKCPQCQSDLRNWFVRHWIISILIGLVVLGIIGSGSNKNTTTDSSKIPQGSTEKQSGKQYVEVVRFSGKGQKSSEPFKISGSRFKVTYDCKGDTATTYCGAFAYKVGSNIPQGVMNATQAVKDETVIYGSGEYYITANTMGDFSMVIYDYK